MSELSLRSLTAARVGLGRAGVSLDTSAELDFRAAHVRSAAPDRGAYLKRPDLGRRLARGTRLRDRGEGRPRLTVIVADGLSALAADRHALPLLAELLPLLGRFKMTTAVVAEQARVALGTRLGPCWGVI